MTSAGYISNQLCPTVPEHGKCHLQSNGYYCPHHDHDHPAATKNYWHFDEWEQIKSLPTDTAETNGNLKIKIEKPNVRPAKTSHRRTRKANRPKV